MEPGYSNVYCGSDWQGSDSEEWDIEVLSSTEQQNAEYVGERVIDDYRYQVWKLASGKFAAQLKRGK